MGNSLYHAKSSANKWGGTWEDYIEIHKWLDASKELFGDVRHRALRHHTQGCFEAEAKFGIAIKVGKREVPVRDICEQHIVEDLGFLPTLGWWLDQMQIHPAMSGTKRRETRNTSDIFRSKNG